MDDPMDDTVIEIRGGAGVEEAAAIVAVITHLLDTEAAAGASPRTRPRQNPWVVAGLPRATPDPLPSHTYSSVGWSEMDDIDAPEQGR